jgi:hypothetical protein
MMLLKIERKNSGEIILEASVYNEEGFLTREYKYHLKNNNVLNINSGVSIRFLDIKNNKLILLLEGAAEVLESDRGLVIR